MARGRQLANAVQDLLELTPLPKTPPGRHDPEGLGPVRCGFFGRLEDPFAVHQRIGWNFCRVAGRLGAELTILRAIPGFRVDDRTEVNSVSEEMNPHPIRRGDQIKKVRTAQRRKTASLLVRKRPSRNGLLLHRSNELSHDSLPRIKPGQSLTQSCAREQQAESDLSSQNRSHESQPPMLRYQDCEWKSQLKHRRPAPTIHVGIDRPKKKFPWGLQQKKRADHPARPCARMTMIT